MEINIVKKTTYQTPVQDKYQFVTVVLRHDLNETEKVFRCIYCGKLLFTYHSDIRIIMEGKLADEGRPLDVLCRRCNVIYRIL